MSEEEKEAILNLRLHSSNTVFSKYDGTTCLLRARDVQILLNLVEKQQKELDKKDKIIKEKIEEYEEILQSSIIKEDYKKEVEHIIRVLKELRGEN